MARSAESRSDDAPNARATQADANLDQGLFIYIYVTTQGARAASYLSIRFRFLHSLAATLFVARKLAACVHPS